MTPAYDAVTFDFWNTLVATRNEEYRAARATAVRAVLEPQGVELSDDDFEKTSVFLFEQFNENWAANRQFTARHAADIFLQRHAPDVDGDVAVAFVEAFGNSGAHIRPDLAPNVVDTLRAIDEAGLGLAIICDVGTSPSTILRAYLEEYDVLRLFDHWSFSDEVECYKPHRAIFDHALEGLGGVDPTRVAHVGDLRRTDVAGALDLGMTAIRYRGLNDDSGDAGDTGDAGELIEAHHVVDDHADIPALLGLV